MSVYDDNDKDCLFDEMREFLKDHYIHDLLEIVQRAIEYKEEGY